MSGKGKLPAFIRLMPSPMQVWGFHFSHKVAWGAALVARLTHDERYEELATSIVDYLLSIQEPDGVWLGNEPNHVCFDQTAEIAIWLKDISAELGP